jgi:hypothetical protein
MRCLQIVGNDYTRTPPKVNNMIKAKEMIFSRCIIHSVQLYNWSLEENRFY